MSFLIAGRQFRLIFIQKETPALVLSLQLFKFLKTSFFNTLKKNIIIRSVDEISIAKLITQLFTFKISVFQVLMTTRYIKSYQSKKKSLKVVNNTIDDIGLWWLLTFQNSYAEISQLILMTDLINNHTLLVSFLECF